jgi:hypothetical protein
VTLVAFTTLVALAGLLGLLEGCGCNAGRRLWGLTAAGEASSVRSASLVWSASWGRWASWGVSSAGIVRLASLEDALDLVTKSLELLDAVAHFDQKWGEIAAATNQIASLAICRVLIGLVAFTVVSLGPIVVLGLVVILGIVIALGSVVVLGFVATLRAISALRAIATLGFGAIAALGLVSALGAIATIGLVSIAGFVAIVGVIAIARLLGLVARIVLMSRLVGGSVLVGLFHATIARLLTVGSIATL